MSLFQVDKAGIIYGGRTNGSSACLVLGNSSYIKANQFNGELTFGNSAAVNDIYFDHNGTKLSLAAAFALSWSSTSDAVATSDLFMTRAGTAALRHGKADAAAPVAQTIQVQSVVAGTTNTGGVDWTFIGSKGTGTAAGGKIIFQTTPAGATGTSQNAVAAAITLTAPAQRGGVTQQPSIVLGNAALATADTDGYVYVPTCAGTPTGVPTTFTGRVAFVYDTTAHQFWIYDGGWLQPKTAGGAAIVTWQ